LSVFLGGAFVVLLSWGGGASKLGRALAILLGILFLSVVFLVNFWVVWLGLALCTLVIIFHRLKMGGRTDNPLKPVFVHVFVLALSAVLLFIRLPLIDLLGLPAEISPTTSATFRVASQTLKEGPKNLFLGSGPATFSYQYGLYRGVEINWTNFWQLKFDQGSSAFLTFLSDWGLLGALSVLLLLAALLRGGFKTLIKADSPSSLTLIAFVGSLYFLISWLFYQGNFSLFFAAFLLLGLFVLASGTNKEFLFTKSPQKAFFLMLVALSLIVGSILGIYQVSRQYIAAVTYAQGLDLISSSDSRLDEGLDRLKTAVSLDQKDVYLRDLSQALLFKINALLSDQNLSQEDKQAGFQEQISVLDVISAALTGVNPRNSENWFQAGVVYENLGWVNVAGSTDLAVSDYRKAAVLDPKNPQIPFNLGRVFKSASERMKAQIVSLEKAEKPDLTTIAKLEQAQAQDLDLAISEFQKAVDLKNNFSDTYYLLAQTYELQGKKTEALENYQIVLELQPDNKEVVEKLKELQSAD